MLFKSSLTTEALKANFALEFLLLEVDRNSKSEKISESDLKAERENLNTNRMHVEIMRL